MGGERKGLVMRREKGRVKEEGVTLFKEQEREFYAQKEH